MEQDLAPEPSYGSRPKKRVNAWKVATVVFVLLFVVALFTKGFTLLNITGQAVLSQEDARTKANEFMQKYLVLPGITIVINDIAEESDLYAMDITATADGQSQNAKVYMSKDGKLFFMQAIPLDEVDSLFQQQDQIDIADEASQEDIAAPTEVILSSDDDPYLGSKDAKVQMELYTEFQCPDCVKFVKDTLPTIKSLYLDTGKAYLVIKDFPLPEHRDSFNAALAANCANEQGSFWQYHDELFIEKDLEIKDLKRYSSDLDLDSSSFNTCLDSEAYKQEIEKDIAEGKGKGARSTPTLLVNGRQLKGYITVDALSEIIEEELS